MIPQRGVMLIPIAALIACAGGTTMRVAQDDTSGDEAVSLAPSPVSPSDSAASDTTTSAQRERASAPQQPEQGYGGYGSVTNLEIRRIGQWTRTGVGESRRLVIRDANAWTEFWSELGVGERPAVDFTRDVVVAVAAGQRPTGGYEIVIEGVRQQDRELMVQILETTPGPNCMTTASLTQPVDVIVVPAVNSQSWSFVERKEVRGCR